MWGLHDPLHHDAVFSEWKAPKKRIGRPPKHPRKVATRTYHVNKVHLDGGGLSHAGDETLSALTSESYSREPVRVNGIVVGEPSWKLKDSGPRDPRGPFDVVAMVHGPSDAPEVEAPAASSTTPSFAEAAIQRSSSVKTHASSPRRKQSVSAAARGLVAGGSTSMLSPRRAATP